MEKTKRNPIAGIGRWFRETKSELKKVVWPSFAKVRQNTLIVLLYILVVGVIIWALDAVFTWVISFVTGGGF